MDFFLNKDMVLNKTFSDDAILAYIGLRGIMLQDTKVECISLNRIAYTLVDDLFLSLDGKHLRAMINHLDMGLHELDVHEIIKIKKHVDDNEYIIDLYNITLNTGKDFFIKITQEEVKKILGSSYRIDLTTKLMRYFIYMLSYLNHSKALGEYQGLVGEVYFKTIYSSIGVSRRSATRYNNLLTDQKLIYIYRSKNLSAANIYSRYKDMDKCIEYGRKKEFIK